MRRLLAAAGSHPSTLHDSINLTTDQILAAARAGDAAATEAIANMSRVLGQVAVRRGSGARAGGDHPRRRAWRRGGDLLEPGVTAELSRRLPVPQTIPPVRAATLGQPRRRHRVHRLGAAQRDGGSVVGAFHE